MLRKERPIDRLESGKCDFAGVQTLHAPLIKGTERRMGDEEKVVQHDVAHETDLSAQLTIGQPLQINSYCMQPSSSSLTELCCGTVRTDIGLR